MGHFMDDLGNLPSRVMVGGGRPASAYALALAQRDWVKSLNMKQNRKSRMVSPMKRPTMAGTVVSAKGPKESAMSESAKK